MTKILDHLKGNAVAYLALFVALGGTGYAAIRLPAGSVGNRQLKNHSVTPVKLDRGSIAGYVRAWVQINSQGQITASRPSARLIVWRPQSAPGGLIEWSQPFPPACFALATTTTQDGVVSYASAQAAGGPTANGQAAVLLSAPARPVNVAIVCPQP